MEASDLHSNPYDYTDSDSENQSSATSDEDTLLESLPKEDSGPLQDTSQDPKIVVSDHESDNEPSREGYDSDDSPDEDLEDTNTRHGRPVSEWCTCNHCEQMSTDLESYCCRESDLLLNTVILEHSCVTELDLFKSVIEDKEVLEFTVFGAAHHKLAMTIYLFSIRTFGD